MTVNEIIERLYISKDLDDCIRKLVRRDHWEDFKQEFILKMYEIPEERLLGLNERNELKFYVVRSLINLVKLKHGIYQKRYLDYNTVYDPDIMPMIQDETVEIDQRILDEAKEEQILNEVRYGLDNSFNSPFYRCILEAVDRCGSMREASRVTGIHVSVISRSIKKIREHLNRCYNGEPDGGVY